MLGGRRCPATICAALVFIALAAVSSAELDAKNVLKDCELCKKFINFDAPQPVTGPSQSFLDHYAAVISGDAPIPFQGRAAFIPMLSQDRQQHV